MSEDDLSKLLYLQRIRTEALELWANAMVILSSTFMRFHKLSSNSSHIVDSVWLLQEER